MCIIWTHMQICFNAFIFKDYLGVDASKDGKSFSALRKDNVTLAITEKLHTGIVYRLNFVFFYNIYYIFIRIQYNFLKHFLLPSPVFQMSCLFCVYQPNPLEELYHPGNFSRGVGVEGGLQPLTDDALMYAIGYATDCQEASPNYTQL